MRHTALLLLVLAGAASAAERELRFSGTVSGAQEYRKEIGAGLVFGLQPDGDGWTISITSKTQCTGANLASVVTPPYRSRNALMINTDYGVTAKDAARGVYEFEFVLNCRDYRRESERLTRVLWPYTFTEAQVADATSKLGSSPSGKGRLRVVDSKIGPSDHTPFGRNLGRIDWVRFQVHLTFP